MSRKMLKDTKIELKKLGKEIREFKNQRPFENRNGKELWTIESVINQMKYEFRHTHIAYCELRGRTREEIEKPADSNPANNFYIDKIKKEILKKYEEQQVICNCA